MQPPPQQPMPPWMMPPPPKKKPWAQTTAGIVIIVTSASLALMFTCVALIVAVSPKPPPGALATYPPEATATATATPRGPHLISGATIGGTQAAFTARYGSPDVQYGIPAYTTTIGPAAVEIRLSDLTAASDGQPRVDLFTIADPDGNAWTTATSAAVVAQFFPPDARHVRDDQTPDVGTLHVEQSADLAATFPASAFTNTGQGGGLEPPGTFSYTCDAPGDIGCTVSLGE